MLIFTDKMSVVSCNINGSNNMQKFVNRHVYGRGIYQPSIICLQELKITPERMEDIQQYLPEYKLLFSLPKLKEGDYAKRGVVLAIHNKLNPKILKVYRGDGWYVLTKCSLDGMFVWLGSVYIAIQRVSGMYMQLFDEISEKLKNEDKNVFKLLAGDYNIVLENIDCTGVVRDRPRKNKMEEFMSTNELLDVWRVQHQEEIDYTRTYTKKDGTKGASRLDYFLISQSMLKFVSQSLIGVLGGGDHCAIKLDLNFSDAKKNMFRFPPSLLTDKLYRLKLKERIEQLVQDNAEACDQTLWELIKCEVRTIAVKHVKHSRKIDRSLVVEVERKAREQRIEQTMQEANSVIDDEIDTLFEKSDKERLQKNWANKYGKSGTASKYFFRKIKNRLKYVDVLQLRNVNGDLSKHNVEVLNIAAEFYDSLYKFRPITSSTSWSDTVLPQIDEMDIRDLDKDITELELVKALKTLRKGRAPGNDGLTVEFYLHYWDLIGTFFHRALLDSINKKLLGSSQRDGLIKLIPKKGKDLLDVANWRGICLLNVDYKIFTKVLALRLMDILPRIIHPDQKRFVKGRRISHAVYDLFAVQNLVEEEELDVILEALDIRKAFDSLSWEFLDHAYACFGFTERFRDIIQMLYKERNIYIANNGELSQRLRAGRGCPQGDPLSPINFIIAIELFAERIRYNDNIKPVSVLNCDKKLNLVADDVLLMYQNSVQSCRAVSEEIRLFATNSGLILNEDKCAIMRIGKNYKIPLPSMRRSNIPRCPGGFRYVGINYKVQANEMAFSTFDGKIKETLRALCDTSLFLKNQPLLARIYGIRTVYWSKINYLLYVMPNMRKEHRDILHTRFSEAIWRNGRHMVKRDISIVPTRLGGLGAMDVDNEEFVSKIMSVREIFREMDVSPQFWQIQLQSMFQVPLEKAVQANVTIRGFKSLLLENKKLPKFWEECFSNWCKFHYSNGDNKRFNEEEVMHRPVVWNSMLNRPQCNKVKHWDCLEHWDLNVVADVYNIVHVRIPKRAPICGVSCVNQSMIDSIKSKIRKPLRKVRKSFTFRPFARRFVEMNVERKEIVNIVSEQAIQDIMDKWLTFGIRINRDEWVSIANKAGLFITNKIRSFFVLFNLKAFVYRDVVSKYTQCSNLCRLCGQDIESWKHVYWECAKAQLLWKFIYSKIPENMKDFIQYQHIVLGLNLPDWLLVVCTLTKWLLHCARFVNVRVNTESLVRLILKHLNATKNYVEANNKLMSKAWSQIRNISWSD